MSIGNDGIEFNYESGLIYCYGINHDVSSDMDGTPISNGSGKTVCLVDAPIFALFGRTQRNINKSEMINIYNENDCLVKLYLEKDGVRYIVERGLKPDKILIYKNGEVEKEESKKREANKIIVEEILDGISFEVFKNLIVLNGTSSKHFFEYGKGEKRVFINEVFRLGFLDYLQDNLTEEVKEKKNKLEVLDIQRISKEKEVERFKGLYDATESGDVVDISIEELQQKLILEQENFNSLKTRMEYIEESIFSNKMDAYIENYNSASKKLEESQYEFMKNEFREKELQNLLTKMKDAWTRVVSENICDRCTQTITTETKERIKDEIKKTAIASKEELNALIKSNSEVRQSLQKMKDWIDSARTVIQEYEIKSSDIKTSGVLIEQYNTQIQNKKVNPNNLDKINEEIKRAGEELVDLNKKYDFLKTNFIIYKVCRDVVSDKNFYGYYISVFRKYLNQTINRYLERIASPHRIQFNNELDAEVSDGSQRCYSYENLSSGEKSKINLSLLLSFFDVLYSFHRMRTSLLVLDEVIDAGGIDKEGIKLLHEILKEKADENKDLGIYVVSHKNAESLFTDQEGIKKIIFEKRNGFTSLKS
jgi:DNA repair exonuclease SbcCD ATPase subunit